MNIPKLEELDCAAKFQRRWFEIHYPEFSDYLIVNYPWCDNFAEQLYAYYHGLNEKPLCPVCGKPLSLDRISTGYKLHCSKECASKDKETGRKKASTLKENYGDSWNDYMKEKVKEKYGVENVYQLDSVKKKIKETTLQRYGTEHLMKLPEEFKKREEKAKQTCMEKYGKDIYAKTDEFKDKLKNTCLEKYGKESFLKTDGFKEKFKQTCNEKYGVEHFAKTKEFQEKLKQTFNERYGKEHYFQTDECREKLKQTCIEKYGVEHYTHSEEFKARHDEIQKKSYNTKKSNHTFNTSSIEKQLRKYFDDHNINYKYQYRSEKYPFVCDFYFPEKDLYLEVQGNWTHGSHPFDSESIKDQELLKIWEEKNTNYYRNAIKTWTELDTKKRKTAADNKLNYLEIFSIDLETVIKILFSSEQWNRTN